MIEDSQFLTDQRGDAFAEMGDIQENVADKIIIRKGLEI